MVAQMKTKVLQPIMPEVYEAFPNKKFDVMGSMSHNMIKDKLENQRVSGFQLDKNGNFRFTFNIAA